MREVEFAHFSGQFGEQRQAIGIAIDRCGRLATLQATSMIGRHFGHRAVDDLRAPCRLFKIGSFGQLTRANTGQDRR